MVSCLFLNLNWWSGIIFSVVSMGFNIRVSNIFENMVNKLIGLYEEDSVGGYRLWELL